MGIQKTYKNGFMRVTNKHNLPEPVFNFLARDRYQAGDNDISVTTLIKPPQIVFLEKEHSAELEVDAIDLVWSLVGSGVHTLLDAHTESGAINEERFYVTINGVKIGGQIDHYRDGVITDYKVTSAFSVAYNKTKPEWEEQLNCYAYILNENGLPIRELRICAILRDWDRNRAKREMDYPQAPIQIITLPVWDVARQLTFIERKLAEVYARPTRQCTPEEMWQSETRFACVKVGNKRATKVFDTEDEAMTFVATSSNKMDIVKREGERKRCADYCSVSKYCSQWGEYCQLKSVENVE